jgi:hypothetical protein
LAVFKQTTCRPFNYSHRANQQVLHKHDRMLIY